MNRFWKSWKDSYLVDKVLFPSLWYRYIYYGFLVLGLLVVCAGSIASYNLISFAATAFISLCCMFTGYAIWMNKANNYILRNEKSKEEK